MNVSHEKSKGFPTEKSTISDASTASVCSSDSKLISFLVNQRQQIIDSDWGGYALDLNLWNDSKSPVVQIKPCRLLLDDEESRGFLSDRLIGLASSFLTKSPENGLYVLSKCVMQNKNLIDITALQHYRHLQYVNVANNNISDLSPLSNLSYLMYLKASHNKINCISNFTPPWYLTYVNLSHNQLTSIGDLQNCWSIVKLNLSYNVIETISGLDNLKYLQYLDLSYNLIECITNLDNLNIQNLNLEGNCIKSFKSAIPGCGINTLLKLRTILLGYNKLSNLEFFKDTYSLRYVDLRFNKIADLLQVLNLKGLIFEVDFRGNTCTKWPNYRNVLISSIPSVRFIDGIDVPAAEKVTSAMLFASPLDLTAARKVANLMLLEQLNITEIKSHVQTYDELSPPLIVLTGPLALKKMTLALHIARTIPDKVKYCRWHCTKEIYENEEEHEAYILIKRENFNDMAQRGEFLVMLDLLGHNYGFHIDQIALLMSEKKIGLTDMNLNTTTEMSKRYSNLRPILLFTQSVNLHKNWIRKKFDIYTWIKDSVEDLLAVKIGKREDVKETASSIFDFIQDILDEIISRLDLPTYSIHVRPQGTATSIDIIRASQMMLPRFKISRKDLEKRKPIKVRIREKNDEKLDDRLLDEKDIINELKVLLQDAQIIIDDEETKRELHKSRMKKRREILISKLNDLAELTSTDEEPDLHPKIMDAEKLQLLKDTYTELVIKSRKLYSDYHESHPGFFALVLFMDHYAEAFDSLNDFINKLYTGPSYREPIFLPKIDYLMRTAVPPVIDNILDEIRENLSTSEIQRKSILKMHRDAPQKRYNHTNQMDNESNLCTKN